MGQIDARLSRGYPAVGTTLERLPAMSAPSKWNGSFSRRKGGRVSPSRPVAPATNAEVRRVVLVDSDQYYREVLTFELLCQGFVVHAFADGASLLDSLATAIDADLAVFDWHLPKIPGLELMAKLRHQGVNLPVVFLTGQVIAGNEHEQCLLAPRETLNAHECMAFDQGAVDFIAKSRDRRVLVRRLRRVVERVKPKTDVSVEERVACGKLRLNPETSRTYWNQVDVGLTFGEFKIVNLLASNVGRYVTYRGVYDCLHYEGFIAGTGEDGYRGECAVGDQAHPQQVALLRPRLRRDQELHRLRILLAQAIVGPAGPRRGATAGRRPRCPSCWPPNRPGAIKLRNKEINALMMRFVVGDPLALGRYVRPWNALPNGQQRIATCARMSSSKGLEKRRQDGLASSVSFQQAFGGPSPKRQRRERRLRTSWRRSRSGVNPPHGY
jgi:two-component system response regulator ChvI